MAYDPGLDARVEEIVSAWGAVRKRMFGGTGYLLHGNMMAGVLEDRLILRLGEAEAALALEKPHASPFAMTGRPMKGWVMIDSAGATGDALPGWLDSAKEFTLTLPPK